MIGRAPPPSIIDGPYGSSGVRESVTIDGLGCNGNDHEFSPYRPRFIRQPLLSIIWPPLLSIVHHIHRSTNQPLLSIVHHTHMSTNRANPIVYIQSCSSSFTPSMIICQPMVTIIHHPSALVVRHPRLMTHQSVSIVHHMATIAVHHPLSVGHCLPSITHHQSTVVHHLVICQPIVSIIWSFINQSCALSTFRHPPSTAPRPPNAPKQ